ncbi:MAG: hypothetical protein PHR56_02225 [Dehalococcoidales bacterium]|nr:hypothetical protein [Dehalococcoidales bacterium]
MKIRTAIAIFTLACFALIVLLLLGLGRQGEETYVTQPSNINSSYILLGIAGGLFVALVLMGIFLEGKERWKVLTLAAILLILFSALSIFSIGIFLAPIALLLLGFSIWKIRSNKVQV